MKILVALGAVALLALAIPLSATASDSAQSASAAQQETATAQAHALMAADADSLKMVHAHLQHAVNCLVGPGGKGYDAAAADPCKGQGQGALNDAAADVKLTALLHQALTTAERGLQADQIAMAQQAAKKTAELLAQARKS